MLEYITLTSFPIFDFYFQHKNIQGEISQRPTNTNKCVS